MKLMDGFHSILDITEERIRDLKDIRKNIQNEAWWDKRVEKYREGCISVSIAALQITTNLVG